MKQVVHAACPHDCADACGVVITVEDGRASLNWAKMTPGFQSINALTSEKLTDMGNSATFYSVLVEVELSKPSP